MISEVVHQNLARVLNDISAACLRAQRDVSDVRLVAVTKYAEWNWVEALAVEHTVFGENRPQQLAERQALMPDAKWHLIGQLQRNKVKSAVMHAALIHSVESLRLLRRIASVGKELDRRPRVLLQINISGEESKSGFSAKQLNDEWHDIVACHDDAEIVGLMTMAPASDNPEDSRNTFRGLADLRSRLSSTAEATAAGISLPELSMGMSGDFKVAIEEGATLVRIGSRLFEGL